MIDFDILLTKLGTFRPYQLAVFFALNYFGIPSGLNALASVFLSYTPEYRCLMNPLDNSTMYPNLTGKIIMNWTTPLNDDDSPVDACVRYGYNLTECAMKKDLACVDTSSETVKCYDFYYDDILFTSTVVSEFNLVCERRVLNSVGSSMYMVGFLIGAVIFGNVSDRFGRKITIIFASYAMLLSMLGVAYCNSIALYIGIRFLVAVFAMGANIGIFTHIMEIVGSKWRTMAGIGYQISFAIGYMLWSAIAYLYRDWHQMQLGALVVSAPLAIIVLIVPESPRWLFTNGRDKQGKNITRLMARMNKVDLPDSAFTEAEKSKNQAEILDDKKYSTIDLFRYSGMRILTIKVAFNWAVNSMVYYGISLNAGALAGDIFLNNIYAGIFEIACYILCIVTMDRVGRRLLLTITLTGSGAALLVSTIVNEFAEGNTTLVTLGVAFAFVGKGLISGSFAVIYNFTSELYPTVVRSNGIGFGSMSARIGSILSPFIISIQDYITWLPNTIFGVFAVVGGLLSLTFRDTTGRPMMETVEEAERFYNGKGPFKADIPSGVSSEGFDNKAVVANNEEEEIEPTAL